MSTDLYPTHTLEAAEAEFETAFEELCTRYNQIEADKNKQSTDQITPAETIQTENKYSDDYLQPAAENIADAARSIANGDLRSAEESFGVAMALGLPGAAIMNVAQDALEIVKPKTNRSNS